ncbi:MAG: ATP-binding cassette domain-containing protein [Vicinamibacterales bacterium]
MALVAVTAGYGSRVVLRDVTLAVRERTVTLLIGANGAGKSTVLKTLIGLVPNVTGDVFVGGRNVTRLSVGARVAHGVAYVRQGGAVFPSLTLRDNLELGLESTARVQRTRALDYALTLFPALKNRLSGRAGLLSGGQRVCLALAVAICRSPRVLLVDEPSAGLAPALANSVLRSIRELNRESGVTVLLVEQRIREAIAAADHALAFAGGAIVAETASPTDWLAAGILERYFLSVPEVSR